MKLVILFFKNIYAWFFAAHIDWEIYNRIFPHINCEKDCGYPFDTRQQYAEQTEALALDGRAKNVEADIDKMPDAFGRAFRYIMRRDLHRFLDARYSSKFQKRLRMYVRLAPCCIEPETCDPRFIARRA